MIQSHRRYPDETEFTIKARMRSRWVPQFLSMLRYLEYLGCVGSSRQVAIWADGDGDFRPEFEWSGDLPEGAEPARDDDGHRIYDVG